MQRGRFDGVLYFSMSLPSPFAEKFRQMKTAVVLVDTYHPAFDSITVDNETGAYEATKHLLTLGHKRIGMIDASLESAPARKRLEGYQKALADFRVDFDNRYLKLSSISKQDGFSREAGYVSMVEMLDLGDERPTATFVSSDVQAIGALNALRDQGLRVPEDMAIVGFDDIELAKHLGITTVRQPMYEMGVLAVDKLLERITNPDLPASHMRFEPKLMVRHSCGATSRQVLPTN